MWARIYAYLPISFLNSNTIVASSKLIIFYFIILYLVRDYIVCTNATLLFCGHFSHYLYGKDTSRQGSANNYYQPSLTRKLDRF